MPEYELRDNLDRLPKVIYFTESFLSLNIQTFLVERKDNHNFYYDNSWNKFIL